MPNWILWFGMQVPHDFKELWPHNEFIHPMNDGNNGEEIESSLEWDLKSKITSFMETLNLSRRSQSTALHEVIKSLKFCCWQSYFFIDWNQNTSLLVCSLKKLEISDQWNYISRELICRFIITSTKILFLKVSYVKIYLLVIYGFEGGTLLYS